MKIENPVIGGFEPPSKGWRDFEITEDIHFKVDDAEQETTQLVITAKVINDTPEEEGRRVRINCDLAKPLGRKKLALLLGYTELAGWLEKKLKLNPDLNENDWGAEYLSPSSGSYDDVIQNVFEKLPFKTYAGLVSHSSVDRRDGATDENGKPLKSVFANINEFNCVGYKGDSKAKGTATATASASDGAGPAAKRGTRPVPQKNKPVPVPDDDDDYTD